MLSVLMGTLVVAGTIYVLFKPHWAVVLILLMFPLEQLLQAYIPQLLSVPWIINVGIGLLALMAFGVAMSRGRAVTQGYLNPVTISIWLLYGLAWVSLLYTPSRGQALEMLTHGWPFYALMLLIAPMLIRDMEHFGSLLVGFLILGAAISTLIFINPNASFYTGRLTLELGTASGFETIRGNPLAVGSMGGMMAIAAALWRPGNKGFLLNMLRAGAFVIGLGVAIGSGSRGQVLAAVAAGVLCYPLSRQLANPKSFMITTGGFAVFLVGVYVVFTLFIGDQNIHRWNIEGMTTAIEYRYDNAWMLVTAWLNSPVHWPLGLGAAAYSSIADGGGYVHNMLAEVVAEEGIVGLTFLGVAMYFTYRFGKKSLVRWRYEPELRSIVAVLIAFCIYSFAISLKQGSFIGLPTVFVYWTILSRLSKREVLIEQTQPELEPSQEQLAEQYPYEQGYAIGY